MATIVIRMKTNETREYRPQPRAGGSWTKTIRYEGAFAVVTDEYGAEVAIPASDIAEIRVTPDN